MRQPRLNLGKINYLNCWPIFRQLPEALSSDCFNLIAGHPTELNHGLQNGEIDISPSSSMLLAQNPNEYFILPNISIASINEVRSVILLSRYPLADLSHATIALTNQSLTSIFLLKIILLHLLKFNPDQITFTNEEFSPINPHQDAALVIGDQALKFYHNPPTGYNVYDLGRLWHKFTGLPFVYALWIGRKEALPEKKQTIIDLSRALNSIVASLPDQLESLTTAALTEIGSESGLTSTQLLAYWQLAISYGLDRQALAGLNLFYSLARETGLIDQVPALNFFPTSNLQ